jgi:uncharacterized phage-like protein YoqJ
MVIAGTGHRPDKLGGYSDEAFNRLVGIAEEYLTANRPEKVISGMALGWDQALAQACINLDIPFLAALPFKNMEVKWPRESQDKYNRILSHASLSVVVSEGEYAPWKMQVRNKYMVDNSEMILAMYDGTSGGTANCINYANSVGKPIVNLYNQINGNDNKDQ